LSASLASLLVGFALLGLGFWTLEWLWPALREKPILRKGLATDLLYWFFTPLVSRTLARGAVAATVVSVALAAGWPLDRPSIAARIAEGRGLVTRLPTFLQLAVVLIAGDAVG